MNLETLDESPQPTNWVILNQYPFQLVPGEGRDMEGGGVSYYDYINKRPTETGKNVQCISWLIRDLQKGLFVWEPFGGVGIFAVAVQEILKPSRHIIHEIDATCLNQLKVSLKQYNVEIDDKDATVYLGSEYADVFMVDFPLFSLIRFLKTKRWEPELARMTAQKPKAIIMTDGSSCRYHLQWKNYNKVDPSIDSTRESYVKALSKRFYEMYGYSIAGCAYHANSFYYRLENKTPGEIEWQTFPAGSSENGLRRIL